MELNLNLEYPRNSKYDYEARLTRINLDKEMEHDMATGKGFFIKEPQAINKVIKDVDSICSTRFSHTLQDPKAYEEKYSCKCGFLKGRDNRYIYCEHCHTECTFVGDDFQIFGWIPLKHHAIIHPNLYKTVATYFGEATLEEIIEPNVDLNKDAMPVNQYDKRLQKSKTKRKYSRRKRKVDPTYQGIGMIEFEEKFDEILEYFHSKNKKKKQEYYDDIIANRELIFIHNIPVYTTLLRAFKTDGKRFIFEKTNSLFNMMAKLAGRLNDDSTSMAQTPKYCNSLLWDIQERYNKLYREIELILANKKGSIRLLIGGRCAFTSRLIIVPDPTLRSDQVKLSYFSLVELLQQAIIRVLSSTYNIAYADAYMQWFRSQLVVDNRVLAIIQNLIDHDDGLPMLINRN